MNDFRDRPRVREFWEEYLSTLPISDWPVNPRVKADLAGTEQITDELIDLYLCGKKTAGSSLVRDFELAGDELPRVGSYWIVLSSQSNPKCILKTVRIEVNKFGSIPLEVVQAEGEGDLSIQYWKRVHQELYLPYLSNWGIASLDDADVITEFFELVYP